MKRFLVPIVSLCMATVVQAAVTTHLKLDTRTGVRVPSAEGEVLYYDASWHENGDEVRITDNGAIITTGVVGSYVWHAESGSSFNTLKLEVLSEGQVVGTETALYAKPCRVFTAKYPAECGNASTKTNGVDGVWTDMVIPTCMVTAIASVETNCVFDTWVGTNFVGEAIVFADAKASTTTFTMPATNVAIMACYKIDPKYIAELTDAVTNAAVATANTINCMVLSCQAKEEYIATITVSRDAQVDAILAAKTPAAALAEKTAADTAFASVLTDAEAVSVYGDFAVSNVKAEPISPWGKVFVSPTFHIICKLEKSSVGSCRKPAPCRGRWRHFSQNRL